MEILQGNGLHGIRGVGIAARELEPFYAPAPKKPGPEGTMLVERARNWVGRMTTCGIVVGGLAVTVVAHAQSPVPPAPQPAPAAPKPAADDNYANRPVAYIHGTTAITRQDLGEFLLARGGADKLDLLVNKKIIEHECVRRNITVTEKEMEAAVLEDIEGLKIKKVEFVTLVLPRYGKTYFEWMEDVIKPRLLLAKLCRDRVKVTEEDLKIQYDREFGEKRQVQIIMWPKGDNLKSINDIYAKIRSSQEEFDRAARAMANPQLAASGGNIKPIGKHTYAADSIIETTAFALKEGEVSSVLSTSQGWVVMKLHKIIPADGTTTFETVRPRLEKQAYDERMSQEIPKYFEELKKAAAPNLIFSGPDLWRQLSGAEKNPEDLLKPAGGVPQEKK